MLTYSSNTFVRCYMGVLTFTDIPVNNEIYWELQLTCQKKRLRFLLRGDDFNRFCRFESLILHHLTGKYDRVQPNLPSLTSYYASLNFSLDAF